MSRFQTRNTASGWFCPAVASRTAPTRAELNAGTLFMAPGLTAVEGIKAISGFDFTVDFMDVSDGNSRFMKTAPGTTSAGNPTLDFMSNKLAGPFQTAFAIDTIGYICWAFKGDVAGRPMKVWYVQVGSNNDLPDLGNTPHMWRAQLAVLDEPTLNAVVPA